MRRGRFYTFLFGAMLLVLCLPPSALAGTFNWNMPADFTATAPGSNPDHDAYGTTPWSYVKAPGGPLGVSHDSTAFTMLPQFSGNLRGGLAGWNDPSDGSMVATNPSSGSLSDGAGDSFPVGALALTPSTSGLVAIGWTSPFPHPATVTISGTIAADGASACFSWSLDQKGVALASGVGAGPISASTTVPAGGAVYLTVQRAAGVPEVSGAAGCATAAVTLGISDMEGSGPVITLARPAPGAVITGHQPSFSGTASPAFGASNTVTVRLFSGATTAGTPVQTITTTRSASGAYTARPNVPLRDGEYTAQAEQDDLSAPADQGLSSPNTFLVHNGAASIKLRSLGSRPLQISTPTVAGVAATASGAARSVTIVIYPGSDTNARPLSFSTGAVDSGGAFSVKVTPALSDGRYTVVAVQAADGSFGLSLPMSLRIKAHAPALRLTAPSAGSDIADATPTFSGTAGTALGDSGRVAITLHSGDSVSGRTLGTMSTTVSHGAFSARWRKRLSLGFYTAAVSQSDDAGHTARALSTFLIVSTHSAVGPSVTLSRSDAVTLAMSCLTPGGTVCRGSVLVLTVRSLRTLHGGPKGPVRVLFAHVSIPGGRTIRVTRTLPAYLAQDLRSLRHLQLRITARLTGQGSETVMRILGTSG